MKAKKSARPMKNEKYALSDNEKLLQYYRQNPVAGARDLLNVDLVWFQRYQLRELWSKPYCLMKWGRGTSKCAAGHTLLYRYDTGQFVSHESVCDKEVTVLAMNDEYKLVPAKAVVAKDEVKECFRVSTKSGKSIDVSFDHPIMTINGFVETSKLNTGDFIATARILSSETDIIYPKDKARLFGYLFASSNIKNGVVFYAQEKDTIDDIKRIILNYFGEHKFNETTSSNGYSLKVIGITRNNFIDTLKQYKLYNKPIKKSIIPSEFFSWDNTTISSFIGGYFDINGKVHNNKILIDNYSIDIAKQIQRLLSRFGILSSLKKNIVVISNQNSIELFKIHITVNRHKSSELLQIINKEDKSDTIPKAIWSIYEKDLGINIPKNLRTKKYKKSLNPTRYQLLDFANEYSVDDARNMANSDIFWDEIVSIESIGKLQTYSVYVPKYNNYLVDTIITHNTFTTALYCVLRSMLYPNSKIGIIAPSFRQTGYVFDVIMELFQMSPYFRAATTKNRVTRSTDRNLVEFMNRSSIEGLPIGTDGSKIRGRRYTIVILDEYAFHNSETIELVVRPFLTIQKGYKPNQIVMCSTPYYKTNHFYEKYLAYKKNSEDPTKSHLYSCTSFNFVDVLLADHKEFRVDLNYVYENFLDQTMNDFLMEYGGYFPSESSSFFSSALIESCTPRVPAPIEIEHRGDPAATYVLGVDTAREMDGDNAALAMMKISNTGRHIVKVEAYKGLTFPQLHDKIRTLIHLNDFNVSKIFMDYGGGGRAVADLLAQGWIHNGVKYKPIVEDNNEVTLGILPILRLINFNQATIDYMYSSFKADMEHKNILFPIPIRRDPDPMVQIAGKEIALLVAEMQHLNPVPGTKGMTFEAHPKLGKDRITSCVLANYAANSLYREELGVLELSNNDLAVGMWG